MDFNNNDKVTSTQELTSDIAGNIYSLIKEFGNKGNAYIKKGNSDYDYENFIKVDLEIDRIVKDLLSFKNGKLISPAVYDEEGELVSEEVFYTYSTDEDLCNQVSSDLLDVPTVWNDVKIKFVSNGDE